MRLNIVEIVACYKLANHFVAAEAESETGFVTHSASVEYLLLAAPSRRQSVAYARILIEVESLLILIVHDLRRGKTMEIVHDEHRLAGSRIIEYREGFGGETFSSRINRSHLEMIKFARFQLHLAAGGVHDGSVVKSALSFSLIDNVRSRAGGWFRLVQLGAPGEQGNTSVLRNAEVLRSQRLDHVAGSMIAVYEAQDSFVDGARDIEFAERILSNSHVGETLM